MYKDVDTRGESRLIETYMNEFIVNLFILINRNKQTTHLWL